MTSRSLVRTFLLAAALGTAACGGVPRKFVADRDHFNAAILAFTDASKEASRAVAGATGPTPLTPTLVDSMVSIIGRGLASADSVGDPFLEWLHPELPRRFRDDLVAGERMMMEAMQAYDYGRINQAEQRLRAWAQFWNANNAAIAIKANP